MSKEKYKEIAIKSYDIPVMGIMTTINDKGQLVIRMKENEVANFLHDYFEWGEVYDAFISDMEYYHDDKCSDCSERCDEGFCGFVDDVSDLKEELAHEQGNKHPHELVLDFYRDDSYIMDIFKELKTDELTKILKRIGYEQPHICHCTKPKD